MHKVTIGIPVKNEVENIPYLIDAMKIVTTQLNSLDVDVEIIVNDNASNDRSLELLLDWSQNNAHVSIYHFSNGVSFQESILNLIRHATGDAFIVYQSDLQDPYTLIIKLVSIWLENQGIVVGVIDKRDEKIRIKVFRKIFYWILKKSSDGKILVGFQDFYLIPRPVYSELSKLSPEGLFLRGHISSRFQNVTEIHYTRNDRLRGKTNFSFPQKYSLALDGILLFGTRLIRTIAVFSMCLFAIGILAILAILLSYILGIHASINGWSSLATGILILISMFGMISSLALEYLLRIYRLMVFRDKSVRPNQIHNRDGRI